ncbi:hypothetical protein CQA57_07285 [Helicobacter anseris]|uniref:FHA domain-containing protein n=1 Tax=Helicobacter anseris TaxID=375926 RepID=A0A3D8J524_9HELI|nr:hypothetical protein [Helicobacter anseris]RDU71994.1 hypothetical protein CQA57_07285 [Helicobacter anseris]
MKEVYLKVMNIQGIEAKCSPFHIFNEHGGSIGSGSDNFWVINDKKSQIQNIHAQINFEEGVFGIKPYEKECKIFLNDSFSALPYSYETQIIVGDFLKIGELKIKIMSKEEFTQEQNKTHSLAELGELVPYDELDNNDNFTKGVVEDFNPLEEEKFDLLQEDDDILGLNKLEDVTPSFPITNKDYFVSYKNIQEMIYKKTKELQEQFKTAQNLNFNQNKLKMLDLESRIKHFSLIEDREILNLIILSLLCESLQNPILEGLHPDFFEKSISEIIEDCINGNSDLLKNALLSILSLRSEDKVDEVR